LACSACKNGAIVLALLALSVLLLLLLPPPLPLLAACTSYTTGSDSS